ncbi:MAG: helix-turn-helix domain-containing protein [Alphaproteobacteria bacterium]|nr:helix-turn-helix domain-containing protein [Alphaproteobacteria bacterium]
MPTQGLESIIRQHLSDYFAAHGAGRLPAPGLHQRMMPLLEKPLIEATLSACSGNQLKAANVLGINRNTLRKKMQQHGLVAEQQG